MRIRGRGLATLVAGFVLVLSAPGAAFADEPGESDQAKVLVLQAIALLVNTPDEVMAIDERIADSLAAPDTEGVDLGLVEQAAAALAGGDLRRTRDLLQSSIGAGPYVGTGVPEPIREGSGQPGAPAYAVGAQTGTVVVLDPYEPGSGPDRGELILLLLSAAAIVAGALLSWRARPADTVRQLRRAAASNGASREA